MASDRRSQRSPQSRDPKRRPPGPAGVVFDVLYGFIRITAWEEEIINSPFFQRLRWIKQLGFANYIFPGAEHNRFAHAIGVMHSMDAMVRALGLQVPDHELFDPASRHEAALLHKSLRIAALLHDIGTFPFSHAIEHAYIRHGNDARAEHKRGGAKALPNNHEHLGSFIIKNTVYPGGITHVLEKYGFDVQLLSGIIKGNSPYPIANQLMHSDLDADRMDYLLRDSHYTGIKYGQFDREYLLANLVTFELGRGELAFGVRDHAVHALEDFLIARFSWYSQVIKNPGSAKFDIISSHIAQSLLEQNWLHQFHSLLQMIEDRDERFFWWNDLYFMNRLQEVRLGGQLPPGRLSEWIEMLMYRRAPKTVRHPAFEHRIVADGEQQAALERTRKTAEQFERVLAKHGRGDEWLLLDLPHKDVVFTQGLRRLMASGKRSSEHLRRERDPVKIVSHRGHASLLVERENSLMRHLSGFVNYVPSMYANDSALELLRSKGLVERER